MVKIPTYERQVSVPGSTGQGMAPLSMASSSLPEGMAQVSNALTDAALRIQRRDDFIKLSLAEEEFASKAREHYQKSKDTSDIRDPNFLTKYNAELKAEKEKLLASFSGSGDARANLIGRLNNTTSAYSQTMLTDVHAAQKDFIFKQNEKKIAPILQGVYENPGNLTGALEQVRSVIEESRDVMTPGEEYKSLAAAQDMVYGKALDKLVDSGMYREAEKLLNDNEAVLSVMTPDRQRAYAREIARGLNEQNRVRRESAERMQMVTEAAAKFGVKLTGAQMFSATTGINLPQADATPTQRVDKAWRAMKAMSGGNSRLPENPPPEFIAKVGFGIDIDKLGLGKADAGDPNEEFGPDGKLTAKGIGEKIKAPIIASSNARVYFDKVNGAVELFKNEGNKQALLSAMISFQKALDDGAVVREGDLAMMSSASGISEQIKGWAEKIEGQSVPTKTVNEMLSTMRSFTLATMDSNRDYMKGYLADADARGFRRLDIGVPPSVEQRIFGDLPAGSQPIGKEKAPLQPPNVLSHPMPSAQGATAPMPADQMPRIRFGVNGERL